MEHLVKFNTAEGREGQHAAANLDEALKFVERLRNTEEVSAVRVFRMQEVPIEFRTYYRVELKSADGPDEAEQAQAEQSAEQAEADRALVATPSPAAEVVAENGSGDRRLFNRG